MKKSLWIVMLVFLFLLTGCATTTSTESDGSSQTRSGTASIMFLRSLGCNDQNCTDVSHYHDCSVECADYDHYHSCALDCTEVQHHHSETNRADNTKTSLPATSTVAFVNGMGCNDQTCTDISHHHDCPADCADYDHYHRCSLDCTEAQHHHSESHHADSTQTISPAISPITFVNGMGCSNQSCTDASHHHDCPADCTDYDHYHRCSLDCTEAQHHHSESHHADSTQTISPAISPITFVNGMGCSNQSCTDASHHHDCPADCADYNHYHSCALDCTEVQHHHSNKAVVSNHGEHYEDKHRKDKHREDKHH